MATGHIKTRKGKNGITSYQLVVEVEPDPITGKRNRYYKSVKGTKKQVAEALHKFKNEIESGHTITPSTMKVSDWLDQYVTQYLPNIEDTTRSGYKDKIKNQINPHLGSTPLKMLTASAIQKWVNKLHKEKRLSPKTIKNAFNILKPALQKAVVLQMIDKNPCVGVELPKVQKYNPVIYDTQEMTTALGLAEGTDMYVPLLLGFYLGLRRGEMLALQWDHIDFDKAVVHIQSNTVRGDGAVVTKDPKSAAGTRDISIGSNIVTALKQAHNQYKLNKLAKGTAFTDSNLVVCQKNGKPYKPDSLTQKWDRFMQKHGLKHIRLHDQRHSCTTMMIEAGIDPKTVQTRIGHADVTTTMNIYTHCTKTMDQSAADKIDNLLFA